MRKKFIFPFLFVLIATSLSAGYDISEANQAYQQQNYDKALELYKNVAKEGVKNFSLFYNLGNVYFKLGDIAKTRLYYEKAAKYRPLNPDLQHNLTLIKSNLQDEEVVEKDFLEKIFNNIFYILPINILGLLTLIFFVIIMLLISAIIIYRKGSKRKITQFLIVLFSVLFILSLLLTVFRLVVFYDHDSAVVMEQTVYAYSGPSRNFQQVFTIHAGLKVQIEQQNEEWSLIKLPSGLGGWILTGSLERI